MKTKIITVFVLGVLLYSCSPKVAAPVATKEPAAAPVAAAGPATASSDIASGKELYTNNCAKCHKLFAPKEFSKEDWTPILVRMQKKAHLDDAQMATITNYIDSEL